MARVTVLPDVRGEHEPVLVGTTDCCGARLMMHLGPTMCPVCGAPITLVAAAVDPDLRHLRHQAIPRYWS